VHRVQRLIVPDPSRAGCLAGTGQANNART
jgi:hypothetical protein